MVCLDTTFIIDLIKGDESTKTVIKSLKENNKTIAIATPTIIELIRGLNTKNVQKEENEKINKLISLIKTYPLDKPSAILAGEIELDLSKKGEIIEIEDIMIGAITLQNKEVLITRNKKHFEKISNLEIQEY